MFRRIILSVILALLLILASVAHNPVSAAAVSSTFTAVADSSTLFVPGGQKFRAVISNTWVGTLTISESNNGAQSFFILDTQTANFNVDYNAVPYDRVVRISCTAYTSGTVTYTISNLVQLLGRFRYPTITVGSVAYGSLGTSTTPVAGTWYYSDLRVAAQFQATGIACLNAATVGTNKWIYALYDSGGRLMGNTATAGTLTAGADAFQAIAFTAILQPLAAGQYFIAAQLDGTTDRFRTVATLTFIDVLGASAAGTFAAVPATFTVPTTFTADKAPICYLY